MSVRASLLAILTMGPAYGFQLHGELHTRTGGRRSVNVGQIYSTLERLVDQGAVESAGSTPDGLPLYRLTPAGSAEALHWLRGTEAGFGADWTDMLDRVLIASSLAHVDLDALIARYRAAWRLALDLTAGGDRSAQFGLGAAADEAQAHAALGWLDTVDAMVHAPGPGGTDAGTSFHRELSLVRPRRGRRPASSGGASLSGALPH